MIALLPLWRVMAWIGDGWRDLRSEEREGRLRWQDKSSAVGWGAGICFYMSFTAISARTLLADIVEIGAVLPFPAPSPTFP